MSTDYTPERAIRACDLFDGRLGRFGVHEHIKPDGTTESTRCLSDGHNYLWVHILADGVVYGFTRYATNYAETILNSIADAFETKIISEYEEAQMMYDAKLRATDLDPLS
jgi:hypothetical protein